MPGIRLSFSARAAWVGGLSLGAIALLGLSSLRPAAFSPTPSPRMVEIQQNWPLQTGEAIAGHPILASMGDVSIDLDGAAVYAPYAGETQPSLPDHCIVFQSPEIPAYLLRLCGLRHPRLGNLEAGDRIGRGGIVHLAALRKQPDGTWALVEPAVSLVETVLTPP